MLADQLQQLRVDGRPDAPPGRLATGDGVELQGRVGLDHRLHRHVDAQVERLAHTGVDHGALAAGADEEARHLFEGPLRRRQADPLHVAARLLGQPLQGHREMSPSLGLRHRVDLVDDDPFRTGEQRSRLRREHQVERFRRGDQHVGRAAQHRRPLALRGVARYARPRGRPRRCRAAVPAGCARRRSRALSTARCRRAEACAHGGPEAAARRRSGRAPTERRQASCRSRWAPRPGHGRRRRSPATPGPARAWAPRTPA